jgi:hypothetical protein
LIIVKYEANGHLVQFNQPFRQLLIDLGWYERHSQDPLYLTELAEMGNALNLRTGIRQLLRGEPWFSQLTAENGFRFELMVTPILVRFSDRPVRYIATLKRMGERPTAAGAPQQVKVIPAADGVVRRKEFLENLTETLLQRNREGGAPSRHALSALQRLLLPPAGVLGLLAPEGFDVRYMHLSRREVSGDFVFAHPSEQGVLLGVGDAMGTGLGGALQSLIALGQLEHFSNRSGEAPHLLLHELDRKLEETFTQYAQQQFLPQHASLDLGMVQLLAGTSQVQVASASLQVFHLSSVGECTQLEPTRRPLGCRLYPRTDGFIPHDLHLHPGDHLYLMSDGLSSQLQHRATALRKVGITRVKQWLSEISQAPSLVSGMGSLRQLLQDWQGPTAQTDDITILGIRYMG